MMTPSCTFVTHTASIYLPLLSNPSREHRQVHVPFRTQLSSLSQAVLPIMCFVPSWEQLLPTYTTLVCRGRGSNPRPPDLEADTLPIGHRLGLCIAWCTRWRRPQVLDKLSLYGLPQTQSLHSIIRKRVCNRLKLHLCTN